MKTSQIKNPILALAVIFSLGTTTLISKSAFAQEPSERASRFAALFSLKTIVSTDAESIQQLEAKVEGYNEYYQSLRFFQLGEKNRTGRMNCAEVQATFFASAIMLSSMIEENGEALKQIPEVNNDTTLAELSNLTEYLHEAKAAQDNCSIPANSLVHIRKARALITEVNSYLEKIQNELP